MITRLSILVVLAASLFITGCAGGLRVGSEQHGIGAGAAVGSQPRYPTP